MFKKILVPLDGSDLAEEALEPALALAEHARGEVLLLRVPDFSDSGVQASPAHEFFNPEEAVRPMGQEVTKYLSHLQAARARPGVTLRALVVSGDRAAAIVDTAVSEHVDLIVMSTHGRTGLSRWVLGSITERVLRHAPCPVMVIHPLRNGDR